MDASARSLSPDTPRELLLAFVLGQDAAPRAGRPRRRRGAPTRAAPRAPQPAGHAPGPPAPVQASLSARRRDRAALCTIAPCIREICAQRGGSAPLGDSAVDALERGARRWLAVLRARLARWKARAPGAADAGRLSCADVGACLLPVQTLRLERFQQFCDERRRLLSVCSFVPGISSSGGGGASDDEDDEDEDGNDEEEEEGECLAAAVGAGGATEEGAAGDTHGFGAAVWAAARERATGECGLPAGAVARPVLEMRLELDRAELADRAGAGTAGAGGARRTMLTRPGARRAALFRAWAALAQWPWAVPRDVCDGIALVLTDWLDRVARSARLARQRTAPAAPPAAAAAPLTGADIDACLRAAGAQWFSPPPPWA